MNLAKAADLVTSTTDTLQDFHEDDAWAHLYENVVSVANLYDNEQLQEQMEKEASKYVGRLQDTILLESTGAREVIPSSEDFKTTLLYPVLDIFLN